MADRRDEPKIPLSTAVGALLSLLTVIGCAVGCTLFIVDRIQAVADASEKKFASRESFDVLVGDVKGIRFDVTQIKDRLASGGERRGG